MEYKDFEMIFSGAGFTQRQIKKAQERAYKEFEDANGKKASTGGQRKAAYDFLVSLLGTMDIDELVDVMWKICKASREQSEKLYSLLDV